MRRTQPWRRQHSHSAAPTAPAICGRRSLQSRHGRQNTRPPRRSKSTPSPRRNAVPLSVSAPPSADKSELAAFRHAIRDGNGHLAGQVVVAGAGAPQRPVPRTHDPAARIARRNRHDRLQHLRHRRRGEPVIAMPSLAGDAEQPRVDQPGEVPARGLRGDASNLRQFAGRQAPARRAARRAWPPAPGHRWPRRSWRMRRWSARRLVPA